MPVRRFMLVLLVSPLVHSFCGDSIRWSHNVDIEDVFGMWYGVGYAKHTPDLTNKPNDVGCVTLFISDATSDDQQDDWLDWSIAKRNYSDQSWRSYKSNRWSDSSLSGSWLDIGIKRKAKRDIYNERRVRVIWDEDGQSMEQVYVYSPKSPGLWVAEQGKPLEREMIARGMELWRPYNYDPAQHPQVIRILKVTPQALIISHCSDRGDSGIFSLILRRSPMRMQRWEWYDIQRQLFSFDLPNMHRHMEICAGCVETSSIICVLVLIVILTLL